MTGTNKDSHGGREPISAAMKHHRQGAARSSGKQGRFCSDSGVMHDCVPLSKLIEAIKRIICSVWKSYGKCHFQKQIIGSERQTLNRCLSSKTKFKDSLVLFCLRLCVHNLPGLHSYSYQPSQSLGRKSSRKLWCSVQFSVPSRKVSWVLYIPELLS